jgi:L,D-transpeptidase ErfK/SrfK
MKMQKAAAQGLLIFSAIVLLSTLTYRPAKTTPRKPSAAVAAPMHTAPAAPRIPEAKPQPKAPAAHKAEAHTRRIVVSLEDRRLALVEDGQVQQVYTVAVGKESTPSPTGTFTIVKRVENPTYYHEGKVVPPGPDNPVGTRWMGLSKAGYGIHGTNAPKSIGKAASHGCIRMAQPDLEGLFAAVRTGDEVEIVGTRNDETAAMFGMPAAPVNSDTSVQTVVAQAATPNSQPASPLVATTVSATTVVAAAAVSMGR